MRPADSTVQGVERLGAPSGGAARRGAGSTAFDAGLGKGLAAWRSAIEGPAALFAAGRGVEALLLPADILVPCFVMRFVLELSVDAPSCRLGFARNYSRTQAHILPPNT